MQLISLLNENWSANPGKFDFKDLLELTFLPVTSTCWSVLPLDFPTDTLLKNFLLYLKILRSITSFKYSKRTWMLENWLWSNMCSLPLNQFCSKFSISAKHTNQDENTKIFLATAGQPSWQQEDILAIEPMREDIIAMNTNKAFLWTNRAN